MLKSSLPRPEMPDAKFKFIADFKHCYSLKETWQINEGIDFDTVLKSMYEQFFDEQGSLDSEKLLRTLKKLFKVGKGIPKDHSKALALFQELYRFPYRCDNLTACQTMPPMEKIKRCYGDRITASGVEEMKGGINNILLMAISNKVLIPSNY